MRLPVPCLLLLALVPTGSAARWSNTPVPGRTVGIASWQGAGVRIAMPGRAWLRQPSGAVVRAAPRAPPRVAFASGGTVVGDDGTALAAASAGAASVATALGVAVYSTGDRVAARAGSAAGWGSETVLAGAGPDIRYGVVAAAAGGRVCAAFLRTDAAVGAAETWIACRIRRLWRPAARLSATGHATSSPAVAVDRAGRALVVWRDLDAGRLEYVVVEPSGAARAPTALADGGTSAAVMPVGVGAFFLLYTVAPPGQPATVVRRALVQGLLGPPVRLGRGATAAAVGIGLNPAGRRAYVWLARSRPGGSQALFVRTGRATRRLSGGDVSAGQPALNVAGDVTVPFVQGGRAGVLVYRAAMRLRVVHPPGRATARTTVRLRLRISGALFSHRIRSTCGARTVRRTATTAVVLVQIPARRDLVCTFRVAERGSSARASLTIRTL